VPERGKGDEVLGARSKSNWPPIGDPQGYSPCCCNESETVTELRRETFPKKRGRGPSWRGGEELWEDPDVSEGGKG